MIRIENPSVTGITWGVTERERFDVIDSKRCTKCLQTKNADQFHKQSRRPDGLQELCKICRKELDAARYALNKSAFRATNAKWQKENRAKCAEKARDYYWRNVESSRKRSADYQKTHPEQMRKNYHSRRALMAGNESFAISQKEMKKLRLGPCFYCGKNVICQIDHIIPLVKGGRHSIGNLVSACKFCNNSKHSKFLTEWKLIMRKRNG